MCRSSGGNASARAVEVEPAVLEEERKIQLVWALSVCDNSDLPSGESGFLLNMIMDSGAEELVVSLADWRSLGEPLLETCSSSLEQCDWRRHVSFWKFCGAWMVR